MAPRFEYTQAEEIRNAFNRQGVRYTVMTRAAHGARVSVDASSYSEYDFCMATEKVSLTLEKELVSEARKVVGGRGLSAYVNRALQHQLQRDRLVEMLAELEREHGPIPPEVMEEVRQEWPAPGEKTVRRRSA